MQCPLTSSCHVCHGDNQHLPPTGRGQQTSYLSNGCALKDECNDTGNAPHTDEHGDGPQYVSKGPPSKDATV